MFFALQVVPVLVFFTHLRVTNSKQPGDIVQAMFFPPVLCFLLPKNAGNNGYFILKQIRIN